VSFVWEPICRSDGNREAVAAAATERAIGAAAMLSVWAAAVEAENSDDGSGLVVSRIFGL
jgi:hypothetical protein